MQTPLVRYIPQNSLANLLAVILATKVMLIYVPGAFISLGCNMRKILIFGRKVAINTFNTTVLVDFCDLSLFVMAIFTGCAGGLFICLAQLNDAGVWIVANDAIKGNVFALE